jgi:hypothetical protein
VVRRSPRCPDGDWRPQRPTITRGVVGVVSRPAWAVLYGTAAEDRAMRGPYGIVGLVVTIIVIYVVLHYLLGVI